MKPIEDSPEKRDGRQTGVQRSLEWAKRRRRVLAFAAAILGLVLTLTVLLWPDDDAAEEQPGMPGMEMEGMAGMDMSSDGSIQLTADQLRQFGVTFGTAEVRLLEEGVRTVGIVNFDETRVAEVAPKFAGVIERLYADFLGQPVRAGQPLVEIFSPELVAAQEELLLAARVDANLGSSSVPGVPSRDTDLAQLARRRLQLWDISNTQIDQLVQTGRVRRTLTLYAPVSGVVIEKPVLRGQAVESGQMLYKIADLSEVWIEAELRESDAGLVTEGASADVELTAFPGDLRSGRVEYIYPVVEGDARTLKARIAIPNSDRALKPGMFATVTLTSPSRSALSVPSSAVVQTGLRSLVFVDLGAGSIIPQEIHTGRVSGEYTEVISGVEPGQRVVTSAQYLLDSESNMAEVMRSMIGMGAEGDMGGMDMPAGDMGGMQMDGADMRGMEPITPAQR